MTRTARQIREEIIERMGYVPPLFEEVMHDPAQLETLWQKTVAYYLEGPLPALFKERLGALLSRGCPVAYPLIRFSRNLRILGMTSAEILELLEGRKYERLPTPLHVLSQVGGPIEVWPELDSVLDDALLHACVHLYLDRRDPDCHNQLLRVLGNERYHYLVFYLEFLESVLGFAAQNPQLQADERDPLLTELAPYFKAYFREWPTPERVLRTSRRTRPYPGR